MRVASVFWTAGAREVVGVSVGDLGSACRYSAVPRVSRVTYSGDCSFVGVFVFCTLIVGTGGRYSLAVWEWSRVCDFRRSGRSGTR